MSNPPPKPISLDDLVKQPTVGHGEALPDHPLDALKHIAKKVFPNVDFDVDLEAEYKKHLDEPVGIPDPGEFSVGNGDTLEWSGGTFTVHSKYAKYHMVENPIPKLTAEAHLIEVVPEKLTETYDKHSSSVGVGPDYQEWTVVNVPKVSHTTKDPEVRFSLQWVIEAFFMDEQEMFAKFCFEKIIAGTPTPVCVYPTQIATENVVLACGSMLVHVNPVSFDSLKKAWIANGAEIIEQKAAEKAVTFSASYVGGASVSEAMKYYAKKVLQTDLGVWGVDPAKEYEPEYLPVPKAQLPQQGKASHAHLVAKYNQPKHKPKKGK